ncbi:MAG: tRNA (adenosine(37)-N6)-threonylcarbamoyltransferase complex dimerization subunit type 1 TsaB [Bacteroidales bacterium]|nr:tRNA (adenosine(37)-N6)-threonylcarbamoyltransferase complex dimerization subunit type 1 TsaB [Bacteroidales bacterium]
MSIILNIETATSLCSVSLAKEGTVLAIRESLEEKSHARMLTVFIDEIMKEKGMGPKDLNAVAVGKGPGSYTGLRIGVSTAKGICFGANIPLFAIGTLNIICNQLLLTSDQKTRAVLNKTSTLICPMIDARRMEVYYALFNIFGMQIKEPVAAVVDQQIFIPLLEKGYVVFTGSGMNKCKDLLNHPNAFFVDHIHPSAGSMAALSHKAFQDNEQVNLAYFEPFYLKDFISTVPKKHLPI